MRTRRGTHHHARRGSPIASAPGAVFVPFHFWEAPANRLTNPARDPQAKIPEFKVCACSVSATP